MQKVDEMVINGINKGQESSFRILYDNYFSYLCAYSATYIIDADIAREIVNDVFINLWKKREEIKFPVHRYLLKGVRFGCLSYLRNLRFRQNILGKYENEFLAFEEEICKNDNNPLEMLEVHELEQQVSRFINELPEKCRIIFKQYLYQNMTPADIASEMSINVNTVRVQIKIAFDKLKNKFGATAVLIILLLFKNSI